MSYYYNTQHHHQQPTATTHSSQHRHRSRRQPHFSASHNPHKQFRGVRSMKDLTESPSMSAFRVKFEAGRSFELDDDLEFCPHLLDDEDLQSISSTSSDGSLSSGSPQSSPLPQQMQPSQQVTPTFSLSSVTNSSYHPSTGFQSTANQNNNNNNNNNNQMKIHQPAALRTRNAIPIVNPSTGMRVASPPNSISPGNMMQQTYQRRW